MFQSFTMSRGKIAKLVHPVNHQWQVEKFAQNTSKKHHTQTKEGHLVVNKNVVAKRGSITGEDGPISTNTNIMTWLLRLSLQWESTADINDIRVNYSIEVTPQKRAMLDLHVAKCAL